MRTKAGLPLYIFFRIIICITASVLLFVSGCDVLEEDPTDDDDEVALHPEYYLYGSADWPIPINILQGESRSFVFAVIRQDGHNTDLTFLTDGLPAGVTATFDPDTVTAQDPACTITLHAADDADIENGSFFINGKNEVSQVYITKSIRVLPLNGFRLEPSPIEKDIRQGASDIVTVNIIRGPAFSEPVSLAVTLGTSADITAQFDPPAPTGNSSILTLSVGAQVPQESYRLTISGTAGSLDCYYDNFILNVLPPVVIMLYCDRSHSADPR